MTNEEAIKGLKKLRSFHNGSYGEHIDMAVKALEAQPCIEDYPTCTECEHYDSEKHYCPRFCQVIKDTLAEAHPSEDCISILNRIMEYTYGMLTAEKIGLQHLIKSMMDEISGGGEDGKDSACD